MFEKFRSVSPNRVKINQISEKLASLQCQVAEEKSIKKETFEAKIRILDEKIS